MRADLPPHPLDTPAGHPQPPMRCAQQTELGGLSWPWSLTRPSALGQKGSETQRLPGADPRAALSWEERTGDTRVNPCCSPAGMGPRASQSWPASWAPRGGCSERGTWLRTGTGCRAPAPAPADLIQQRVQHADAEDAAGGEGQAEHEGQVGAVLPLPLQDKGLRLAGAHCHGHGRAGQAAQGPLRVWGVCTRVQGECVNTHSRRPSTQLRIPPDTLGARGRGKDSGLCWEETGACAWFNALPLPSRNPNPCGNFTPEHESMSEMEGTAGRAREQRQTCVPLLRAWHREAPRGSLRPAVCVSRGRGTDDHKPRSSKPHPFTLC